jgi:hypothetical protein
MAEDRPYSRVQEPNRTIYVDTDDRAIALKVAIHVRRLSGEIVGATFASPPKIDRMMLDPNLLKHPQEYEGTKYWVVP